MRNHYLIYSARRGLGHPEGRDTNTQQHKLCDRKFEYFFKFSGKMQVCLSECIYVALVEGTHHWLLLKREQTWSQSTNRNCPNYTTTYTYVCPWISFPTFTKHLITDFTWIVLIRLWPHGPVSECEAKKIQKTKSHFKILKTSFPPFLEYHKDRLYADRCFSKALFLFCTAQLSDSYSQMPSVCLLSPSYPSGSIHITGDQNPSGSFGISPASRDRKKWEITGRLLLMRKEGEMTVIFINKWITFIIQLF